MRFSCGVRINSSIKFLKFLEERILNRTGVVGVWRLLPRREPEKGGNVYLFPNELWLRETPRRRSFRNLRQIRLIRFSFHRFLSSVLRRFREAAQMAFPARRRRRLCSRHAMISKNWFSRGRPPNKAAAVTSFPFSATKIQFALVRRKSASA